MQRERGFLYFPSLPQDGLFRSLALDEPHGINPKPPGKRTVLTYVCYRQVKENAGAMQNLTPVLPSTVSSFLPNLADFTLFLIKMHL